MRSRGRVMTPPRLRRRPSMRDGVRLGRYKAAAARTTAIAPRAGGVSSGASPALDVFQKGMHGAVLDAKLIKMPNGVDEVFGAGAALAMSLTDQAHRLLDRELARILRMIAYRHMGVGEDAASVVKLHRQLPLVIDVGGHLSLVEIGEDLDPMRRIDAEGDAAAGAAALQAEHEARPLGRPAIAARIDAKGAMITAQERRAPLHMGEARIPHQRAVAVDPDVGKSAHRLTD